MPPQLTQLISWVAENRALVIAGAVALVLLIIAVVTVIVGLRRVRRPAKVVSAASAIPQTNTEPQPVNEPRVKRAKLAVGDVASPWTQGIYERHSPEGKINSLLMAFALDEGGHVRRAQNAELISGIDLEAAVAQCDTASGVAVHAGYATLALWHAADMRYAPMALKVASHAHMPSEQKQLIRFLFQDIIGVELRPEQVRELSHWQNPQFSTALKLYTVKKINAAEWAEMAKNLPESLHPFYELELAQKLPVRSIYRKAAESRVYAEGLYRLNLSTLARWLSPRRWQRLTNSDKATRFKDWLAGQQCRTEAEALLQIANPDVYEAADIDEALAEKIAAVLDGKNPHAWLFEGGRMPALHLRLQYFKFFCLFSRYNEAVRCFATLGAFRRDRAQRLWYARALFMSGMHHEAWTEMSSLMADFPRDAAVLNEAGIYAHKLGRYEEAAEIFGIARSYYPDDATLAYNEAVFTEQYSKRQVEEKWSRVQELTQPPVVQ